MANKETCKLCPGCDMDQFGGVAEVLAAYRLDPVGGFLSVSQPPLHALPKDAGVVWLRWESVARELPELIRTGRLRALVDGMECASVSDLMDRSSRLDDVTRVMERIYAMLTFVAHGYVRGASSDDIRMEIPASLAQPWLEAADWLNLPPIATYASTVLYNWTSTMATQMPIAPEDISTLFSCSGTDDEAWFFAVSASIDTHSREAIELALALLASGIGDGSADGSAVNPTTGPGDRRATDLPANFRRLAELIARVTVVLERMYERCRTDVFYRDVRRYLFGWHNDPQLAHQGGMRHVLRDGTTRVLSLAGGSAAQNSLIALFDIVLTVRHDEAKEASFSKDETHVGSLRGGTEKVPFLREMRRYMPSNHRAFLADLEDAFRRVDWKTRLDAQTRPLFAACVERLVQFRSAHIAMVTRYIVNEASKAGVAGTTQGSGGSNVIPFLKEARQDTSNVLSEME